MRVDSAISFSEQCHCETFTDLEEYFMPRLSERKSVSSPNSSFKKKRLVSCAQRLPYGLHYFSEPIDEIMHKKSTFVLTSLQVKDINLPVACQCMEVMNERLCVGYQSGFAIYSVQGKLMLIGSSLFCIHYGGISSHRQSRL